NANMSIIQKFYADQQTNTKMTDEELKKFYNDNLTKYQQVNVRQVLFLTIDQTTQQPLSQEKQDAAKKNAEDILKRVKAGEDIAALAKQYSEDPGSKDNGGEYTFPKGQMVKEFEDWSFSAKVGDVGLVKTQYGYHVIKLEKILGYDDVKDTVKTDAVANKVGAQIEEWKKDTKYTLKKNDSVYNTIKVSE
ncbi:MAG: peptidylprolyl isomerase, partial [Bacillota bacterium]|nr:peptidylprolyl isomerase [Bacillota bacterium]